MPAPRARKPARRTTAAICLACAALAGCSQTDPYVRQGEWRPLGANAANLRAMVDQPSDLFVGRGAATSDGDAAARPVARLRGDQVKQLPASSVSDIKVTDGGAAPAAAPESGSASGSGAAPP